MSSPGLLAAQADAEAVITAVLRGDRSAAADVVAWSLKAAREFAFIAGGNDETPADLWAAWLLHKAAGFPDTPTTEDNP